MVWNSTLSVFHVQMRDWMICGTRNVVNMQFPLNSDASYSFFSANLQISDTTCILNEAKSFPKYQDCSTKRV